MAVSLAFLGLYLFFLHQFRLCIFPQHLLSFLFLLSLPTTHTFFLLGPSDLSLPCVLPFTFPLTRWGMFSKGPCRPFSGAYHPKVKANIFHGNGKVCLVSKPSFNQVSPCTLALFHNPCCPAFSKNSTVCKQYLHFLTNNPWAMWVSARLTSHLKVKGSKQKLFLVGPSLTCVTS